jgi:hypothetical protein
MIAAHDADSDDTNSQQLIRVINRGLSHVARPNETCLPIPLDLLTQPPRDGDRADQASKHKFCQMVTFRTDGIKWAPWLPIDQISLAAAPACKKSA